VKIIAGIYKGRQLMAVEGVTARPTSSFNREMMFSTIYSYKDDFANVLDLYAGSGTLGMEALSRGAEHITFVDRSKKAVSTIIANAELLKASSKCKVIMKKVEDFCKTKPTPFDLIFADPPYEKGLVNPTLHLILENGLLAGDGIIVIEHSVKEPIDDGFHGMIYKVKRSGQTVVSMFSV